ncbi:hypothetical protein BDZ91DRAFT_94200 [Kalaharituber pfeilii]|nr:hypothetical protein BDZ91DRAFT_94200 [Kalaharituber pfeilii]
MTAAVLSPMASPATSPNPIPIPARINTNAQPQQKPRNSLMSPVEPNGAYSQDIIIKSGWLHKRTSKTKNWKKRWFVLRGDRLQCYKDNKEYKVHRQILLSELTACAMLKHTKRENVFGLFSPSKNYHLQGESLQDAQEWVELILKAADLTSTGEEYIASPTTNEEFMPHSPVPAPSSPQFAANPSAGRIQPLAIGGLSCHTLEYSGAEVASCSSFSDAARISQLSLSHPEPGPATNPAAETTAAPAVPKPGVQRNGTGLSTVEMEHSRVIWHGYLWCLKSKGGVRQWKKLWVVVRPVNIAFYKNEEEYRAIRLIPLDNIIDAVEIDPLSKSKNFCMQLITEEKSYRFAAFDETQLAKYLGAIKVTLAKHRRFE